MQLKTLGFTNVFHFPVVDIITKNHFNQELIYENENKIRRLFKLLKDDESKQILFRVISYRVTKNLEHIRKISSPDNMYFPEFITLNDNEVFVDIGAYNGDTVKAFLAKTNHLKSCVAIAFEPDEHNYQQLCNVYGSSRLTKCYNYAIYSETNKIAFNCKGDQSSVDHAGNKIIDAITLDSFFDNRDKPTYIKMDVEGSEEQVLIGARKIISAFHPKLAISIYHKSNDLWEIPLLIHSITKNYDFCIRHHSHNICDTVLYCLPKKL